MSDETVSSLIDRALVAYATLEALGEEIDDEWTYVTDLESAWRERLIEVGEARGATAASSHATAALDALTDEVGRITDPHRAIDWLSTFPQVVLLALGERP